MNLLSVRPRTLVYRGRVEAAGLWFDSTFYSTQEARCRILSEWESGARALEMDGGLLLRFATPRTIRADMAAGAVLVERAQWLLATPLSDLEWQQFGRELQEPRLQVPKRSQLGTTQGVTTQIATTPQTSKGQEVNLQEIKRQRSTTVQNLVLVKEGALAVVRDAQAIDPSEWLDTQGWLLHDLEPLGTVAPLMVAAPQAEFNARRALDIPASPELAAFLAQLRGEAIPQEPHKSWREHLLVLAVRSGLSGLGRGKFGPGMDGGVRTQNLGLSWRSLFQFRFGAQGDAPPLRPGEQFASELSFLFPTLYWFVGIGLCLAFLKMPRSAETLPWKAMVLYGLLLLGVAWGLLVLTRFIPTPGAVARRIVSSPNRFSRGSSLAFDMFALLLLCNSFLRAWERRDWVMGCVVLLFAFIVALWAHWKRRRWEPNYKGTTGNERSGSGSSGIRTTSGVGSQSGGIFQFLSGLFGGKRGGSAHGSTRQGQAGAGATRPKNRASSLNLWLWRTELARLFGAQQARYMMRMMQMFERGDLDAALRHAVPFNLFGQGDASPAMMPPRPRDDLNFLGARDGGGTMLPLPQDIQERLTQYYREAYTKLAAQKRVDEAAFVLAELLDSPNEAVQFLEKHQSWAKAAQLCEARDLDTGLTVRLWWLAGERQRAIVVAKRSHAFADAIARFEREGEPGRQSAQMLRLLWAQHLATAGDFAGAVEAVWPLVPRVPEMRGVVGAWIERGLEGNGVAASRMLARQAHFLDDLSVPALDNWRTHILQLLANAEEEGVRLRLSFATLLGEAPPHELARAAARRTVRALARDAERFPYWSHDLQSQSQKLLDFAADGPLRVDAGDIQFPAPPANFATRQEMLELCVEADDTGALLITDAAWLSAGRILVALGESGARLLNREGKVIAIFDQPCHRLVLSRNEERAIGVALRGLGVRARFENDPESKEAFLETMGVHELSRRIEVARLCRFDLTRKTVHFWGEAELGLFTTHFDGAQWIVTSGDNIISLDTTANVPVALWKTGNAGYAQGMAGDATSLAMMTSFFEKNRPTRNEVWRFDLPALALRERRLLSKEIMERLMSPRSGLISLKSDGLVLFTEQTEVAHIGIERDFEAKLLCIKVPETFGETPLQLELYGNWLVSLNRNSEGILLRLWAWTHTISTPRGQIVLKRAHLAHFNLTDATLTIGDDLGRLIVLDLETGHILRNTRLF